MSDRTGQRLDNYRLLRLLGAGSFGEVYLAEHVYRKTQVAVKVLPQLADDDLPGFLNEARTIRLRHPHIVQVLDFGVDSRVPFLVMEYIPNGTLRQRYPKGTRLLLDMLVSYVKQVADALQYAHDEKLIHRDVKPENILLRSNDEVLLSDFGIATMARSSRSQSVLEEMAGTVAYMAPEQIQGKPVIASDQYALGVIVYEWLCGERPFNGGPIEIATQHLLALPPSLRLKVPVLSPNVEQVVMTALEKEPSRRFASIQAFANALEQASRPKQSVPFPVSGYVPSVPAISPISSSPKELPINVAPPSRSGPVPNTTRPASEKPLLPPSLPAYKPIISPRGPSEPEPESGSFILLSSIGNKIRHSRPFYLSLILLVLLLVGMVGSVGYYYFKATTAVNVPQELQAAQGAINKAKGEVTANPAAALRDLASAQSTLRALLSGSLTADQHSRVLHLLQGDMTREVQAAISSYDSQEAITALPCAGMSSSTPLNVGTTGTQAKTITSVQGKNGPSLLYAIGLDSKLYQVTNSSLIPVPLPALVNTRVLDMAAYGQQLVLLTAQPAFGTPTSYNLALLAPDQSKVDATTTISQFLGKNGQVPKLIAASPPDIYVVIAADSTQTMTTILDYAPTSKVHQPLGAPPTSSTITVSNTIVSLAAFPTHQLFLLLADGTVQSLPFASGDHATSVLVQQPIGQPLPVNAKDFTWTTPVPTVTSGGTTALSVPGATSPRTLAVGLVNSVPHLYILDATLRRILDLKVADASTGSGVTPTNAVTPTATNTGGGAVNNASPVKLHLERQYASATLFAQARSMAVDPQSSQVNVMAQTSPSASSMLSLVSFNASSPNGCP